MDKVVAQAERPIVRVTHCNLTAAMQILACIARPDRCASGGEMLQQWHFARKRSRRENLPELQFDLSDMDIIRRKFVTFTKDCEFALQAGEWLEWQILSKGSEQRLGRSIWRGVSIGALAANHENKKRSGAILRGAAHIRSIDDETGNARSRIWIRRKPVVHMAMAVRREIHKLYDRTHGKPELGAIIYNSEWIDPALEKAENWANAAIDLGIVKPSEPWRFIR